MFEIQIKQEKGMIHWDFAKYKSQLQQQLKRFEGLVVTEDELASFTATRASLNKIGKTIDDERKRVEKLYSEPLVVFKSEVKELVAMIVDVNGEIDKQIKIFEEARKQEKHEAIKAYFSEMRFHLVPIEKLFDDKWLNKTTSEKQWKEQLSRKVENIKVELAVLNNFDVEDKEALKVLYLETLNLSKAKEKYDHNEALKKQLAQAAPVQIHVNPQVHLEVEELLHRKFWCKGTKQQIIAIGDFMHSIGVTFGKIEE